MADNYLQFSESLDGLTPAECEWIKTVLGMDTDDEEQLLKLKDELALEGDVDLYCWPGFEWMIEPDKDGNHSLWLYGDDNGNIDHVSWLVSALINKFRPDMIFTLTWAETCSKPRLGEFGGGFLVVSKNEIVCESTWGQAHEIAANMRKTQDKDKMEELVGMLEQYLSDTSEAKDALPPKQRDAWLNLSAKVADARLMLDKGKL